MGRTIAKKIRGMSLWGKVGLVLAFTLIASAIIWHSPMLSQALAPGDGKVVYGVSANTTPQFRDYVKASNLFGAQTATVVGGTPVVVKEAASSKRNEHIAGYVTSAGQLYIMRWNGTAWSNEWNIAVGGTGANGRRFDIAYENLSGDAVVAYSANVAGTNELRYRVWNGTTWTAATNLDAARITGIPYWVKMESRPGTDEIAMITSDANSDLTAMIWNGTAWGSEPTAALSATLEIIAAAGDADCFDLAYETTSGDLLIAWADAVGANGTNGVRYATRTAAGTWTLNLTPATFLDDATNLDLASDPNSNYILFASIGNAGADLQYGAWDGAAWVNNTANADAAATAPVAGSHNVACGWLKSGATTRGVVVYTDATTTVIDWAVYTPGTGFTVQTDFTPTAKGINRQIEISQDPFNTDRLMVVLSDANSDLWAKSLVMDATPAFTWSDTEGGAALNATLTGITAQAFSYAYDRYVPQVVVTGLADYPAAASVTQGQTNNAMLKFQLATNTGTATWSGGKLDKIGTNANLGDVTFKIFKDTENTGTFTPATDTQIGTGSFSAATGQSYTLTTNQTLSTTNQWYFIVYDVIDTAATATTVGARIADNTYFTADIATGSVTSTSSTASTINASAVTASGLADYPAPASVQQAQSNVGMLKFQLAANYGTATWSGGLLDKIGTNANLADATFKIYKDANANGTLEAATDTVIGTGSFSAATGQSYTLTTAQTITTTASPWYFIAYDIPASAQTATTVGARMAAGTTYLTFTKGALNAIALTSSGTPTINAGTCTAAAPTVSLGTSGTVKPGLSKIYTLSITNNDSSFCGSTTFTIAVGSETGNTASFVLPSTLGAVSTGALAPGATYNTTFTVQAQSGATEGHTLTSTVNVTDAVSHGALPGSGNVTTTVTVWEDSPLLHNSNRKLPSSAKWANWNFKWGIPGGKYGGFTCATCHIPDTTNIKAIRSSITAPLGNWSSSGTAAVQVSFKNVTGMGNDAGGHAASQRICEVCHSRNTHHNYNTAKNSDALDHNNRLDCAGCHPHNKGFIGEGESSGGSACTSCHNAGGFSSGMKGASNYHHYMNSTDGTTAPVVAQPANMGGAADTNRTCLMCHVDHNIFRPDLNAANGGRGKNLRADISTAPVVGDPSTYTNTDFLNDATKNGGICISCHRTEQTNMGYAQPEGDVKTIAIPFKNSTTASQVSAYNVSAHGGKYTFASYSSLPQYTGQQYTDTSTFSGTGTSAFVANCGKCHNDNMNPKSGVNGQKSTVKFGLHTSSTAHYLTSFGLSASQTEGANFCFRCHGNLPVRSTATPSNTYLTANQTQYDWYSSVRMGPRTKNIYADYNDPLLTVKHKVQDPAYVGKHHPAETRADISANKHVTCDDCHNHHASKPGLHIKGVRNLAPALTGARGVQKPISTAWLPAWSAPVFADELVPVEEEWQVCFKCHSNYNTNLTGWNASWNNVAIEFNPRNPAGHAVIGFSRIPAAQPINFKAGSGLTKTSILTCTDCHLSSYDTSKSSIYPSGGHASKNTLLLKGNYDPNLDSRVTTGGPAEMCAVCHDANAYGITTLDPGGTTVSGFSSGTNNMHLEHAFRQGIATYKCAECHSARIHGWKRRGMIVLTGDPAPYLQGGSDHIAGWVQNTSAYVQGNCTGGTGACSAHP